MLSIEQLARLRIEMESDGRDAVLERHAITTDDWMAAQRSWLETVAKPGAEPKFAARYCAVYRAGHADEEPSSSPPAMSSDLDATAIISESRVQHMSTPFEGGAPTNAPPLAAEDVAAQAADLVGATATVSALDCDELGTTLPFGDKSLPDHLAKLTVEQSVSLFVDLNNRPSRREETLQRYGIGSDAELERLRSTWQSRRHAPEVDASWVAAELAYRSWRRR